MKILRVISKKIFTGWPVPSGGKVIRNMAATPEGDIYFTSSGANKSGIVRTGKSRDELP